MSTTTRATIFGIGSGLAWSVIGGGLAGLFTSSGSTVSVFISGVLTGVLASLALMRPLQKFGWWSGVVCGFIYLPLGAFLFGVFTSIGQMILKAFTGVAFPFAGNPFAVGAIYAMLSVVWLLAVVLFPLSIGTTLLLRAVICSGRKHEDAA